MQPRGVIVSAILLAVILAGVLWYSVTRNNTEEIALESPTPTPIVTESSPTPTPEQPGIAGSISTPTPRPAAVAPTVATGPADYALPLLTLTLIAGGLGLRRALQNNR
jgi:hypothetical protein